MQEIVAEIAKRNMESAGSTFPGAFMVEELNEGTLAICRREFDKNGVPHYKEIVFSKKLMKDCLANDMVDSYDGAYGFFVDPDTLEEIKISSQEKQDLIMQHELAHFHHWDHTPEFDEMVYNNMCKLVPDYSKRIRVLAPARGAVPSKCWPHQMTLVEWLTEKAARDARRREECIRKALKGLRAR